MKNELTFAAIVAVEPLILCSTDYVEEEIVTVQHPNLSFAEQVMKKRKVFNYDSV